MTAALCCTWTSLLVLLASSSDADPVVSYDPDSLLDPDAAAVDRRTLPLLLLAASN